MKPVTEYQITLEALSGLGSRAATDNMFTKVLASTRDPTLHHMVNELIHVWSFRDNTTHHMSVEQMQACKPLADRLRRHCETQRQELRGNDIQTVVQADTRKARAANSSGSSHE